jgi:hypothetical protein
MAQRLGEPYSSFPAASIESRIESALSARRFKKQIFLSVDVPPTFLNADQAPRLLLEAEKALVTQLKEAEEAT